MAALTPAVWQRNLFEMAEELLEDLPEAETSVAFDGYEVKLLVGAGGMGEVFLAEDLQAKRRVAIKRLRACWFDPDRADRFRREIDTLAQLEHPFIAHLYTASVQSDGTPYFVMEFVSGLPFGAWCEEENLDLKARMALIASICEAVQYAHRRGIIHLDLKPSNILVTAKDAPKFLDFGIAKQLSKPGANTAQTQLRFTPAFAAPEQLRGELVGTYTDVYALSVILYQLLARELPDPNRRPPSRSPNRIHATAGQWRDLDRLCLRGLEPAVADRYQSADQLLDDIRSFQSEKPLRAGPNRVSYRVSKFVRRNARSLAIAASIIAAVLIGWISFTVRLNEARKEAIAEQNRKEPIESFVLSLFTMGDASAAPRQSTTALDVINYGRKQAELVRNDPGFKTDLYRTLGTLYGQIGDYKQATALLQNALANEEGGSRQSRLARADTLLKLAIVKQQDSEFAEAEGLAREANAILDQVPNCPDSQVRS